jgi:hypothetical protein
MMGNQDVRNQAEDIINLPIVTVWSDRVRSTSGRTERNLFFGWGWVVALSRNKVGR